MFLASDDAGVGVYVVTQSVGVDVLGGRPGIVPAAE